MLKLLIITTLANIFLGNSHSFMNYPVCRRSQYSPYYLDKDLVDYNIMAPLNTYGYKFPCKGFPKGPYVDTITSNKVKINIETSLPMHGGGHCQFGISYDDKTFIVLKQVISSCLLNNSKYEMILSSIPNGKVTIFWTSINAIGNREYYMDCADVMVNIPDNNITDDEINGKELIIVNLPGYEIIPEFPEKGMYDGRDLLENAKNINYKIKNSAPTPSVITTSEVKSTTPIFTTEDKSATPIFTTEEKSTTPIFISTNSSPTKTIENISSAIASKKPSTNSEPITSTTREITTNQNCTSIKNTTYIPPYIVYNYSMRNNFCIYYFLLVNFTIMIVLY